MKILLHTGSGYDPEGGIGQFIINLSDSLRAKGLDVQCLYGYCNNSIDDQYLGNINKRFSSTYSFVNGPWKIHKYLKNKKYDIIHSNAYFSYDVVWEKIFSQKTKIVTTLHGLDFGLHEELKKEIELGNIMKYRKELLSSFYCKLKAKFAHSKANALVSVSSGVAKEVEKYLHLKSIVIPNGAIKEFAGSLIEDKDNFVLFVGTCAWRKGVKYLLDIFKSSELSNYELKIIGVDKEEIKRQLGIVNISSNIQVLGKLEYSQVIKYMKKAKIFLFPSLYEGMPLVVLEAMSYGAIPVISDFNGSEELIQNGINGYVVAKRDVVNFSKHVNAILENKELEGRMRNSCKNIGGKFDWSDIAKQYIKVYEKVMAA